MLIIFLEVTTLLEVINYLEVTNIEISFLRSLTISIILLVNISDLSIEKKIVNWDIILIDFNCLISYI